MRETRSIRYFQILLSRVMVTAMLAFFVTAAAKGASLSPAASEEQKKDELGSSLSPCLTPADKSAGILLGRWCGDLQATALNSNGQLLLVGDDGDFDLRDFSTGKLLQRFTNPNSDSEVKQLLFSPDGSRFAALYENREVRLWKTTGNDESVIVTNEARQDCESWYSISFLAFSPDGGTLAVQLKKKNTLLLWDVTISSLLGMICPPEKMNEARVVRFSPDSNKLFWSGSLWDAATLERKQVLSGDMAIFSPDSTMVVTCNVWKLLHMEAIDLWKVSTGKKITTLAEVGTAIGSLEFTANGNILAMQIVESKKFPDRIVFWNIFEKKASPIEVAGYSIIAAKEKSIICTSDYGNICEIDIDTGEARIVLVQDADIAMSRFSGDLFYWWGSLKKKIKLFKKIRSEKGYLNALNLITNSNKGFTLSGKIENMAHVKLGPGIIFESLEYIDQQVCIEKIPWSEFWYTLFPGKYLIRVRYFGRSKKSVAPLVITAELKPGRRYIIKAEILKNIEWLPILVEEKDE